MDVRATIPTGAAGRRTGATRSLFAVVAAIAALLLSALVSGTTGPAQALANPYQRGPAPTAASLESATGPFEVASTKAPSGHGFGGGTIWYPTTTAEGRFGVVAVSPGFLSPEYTIRWYGPRLASHGFVVITMATKTVWDQPGSRATQLLNALTYVTDKSTVRDRVDPERRAVMGHSMGGGGTLLAARRDPSLEAAVPLTGWSMDTDFSSLQVPAMVISAEDDGIAPDYSHSRSFYESMPESLDKAYLLVAGASHFAPNSPNTTIAKHAVAWLKRFVDDDTRYDQFLCPLPSAPEIAEYQGTCPLG